MTLEGTSAPAVIEHNASEFSNPGTDDAALEALWDKHDAAGEVTRETARDQNGRFAAASADEAAGDDTDVSPEGDGGEAKPDAAISSTQGANGVPLPSNWRGMEETWGKIPPELRESIKAHEDKIHQTLSQQGQALSAYKPLSDVFGEFQEYFNGERGSYKPDEAVRFLFGLQRGMDSNPVETLLQIADTYDLRPKLAEMFGGQGGGASNESALLAKIGQLENTIRGFGDPSRIDERITQKLKEDRVFTEVDQMTSRVSKEMPLYDQIPESDLVSFINLAWQKLGNSASPEAVLKRAYDSAIHADPDLRAKAAALNAAAAGDPERVAAAKRANDANIRSTSSGKTRQLTDEEALGAVYDKHKGK